MALQKHTSASSSAGDKFATGAHLDKPFIVNPVKFVDAFDTAKHKAEPGEQYLVVNVYDVNEGKAYVNALLFNPALVEQLGQYVNANGDDATVVRFVDRPSKKNSGNTYRTVDAGSDADYEAAEKVDYEAAFKARYAELNAEVAPSGGEKTQQSDQKAKIDAAFTR